MERCIKETNFAKIDIKRGMNLPYNHKLKYLYYFNRFISKYLLNDHLNIIYYWGNYSHIYSLFSFYSFLKVFSINSINTQGKGYINLILNKLIQNNNLRN